MKRLYLLLLLCSPAWASYAYRATVTAPHGLVGNGRQDETNFAAMVKPSDASVAMSVDSPTPGQIPHTATVNGQTVPTDLIFTSDAARQAPLTWAIKRYAHASGSCTAWAYVLLGALSHTTDTSCYVSFGNVSVMTFQGGSIGEALDSYAVAMLPFAGLSVSSTQTLYDFSVTQNSGTITPQSEPSLLGSSVETRNDAGRSNGSVPVNGAYSNLTPGTIAEWINPQSRPMQLVRVADGTRSETTARSINWLQTELNNQSDVGACLTISSEQSPGGSSLRVVLTLIML